MPIGTPTSIGSVTSITDATTFAITTSAAITAGNLVVVTIARRDNNNAGAGNPITGVSDGTNTYTQSGTIGNARAMDFWYCLNAAHVNTAASLTATFTGITSSVGLVMEAAQVSGVGTADAGHAVNSSSFSNPTVTTGTLGASNAVVFGAQSNSDGVTTGYTESAGFTNLFNLADGNGTVQSTLAYKIVSTNAATTYNPSVSSGNPAFWAAFAVPFDQTAVAATFVDSVAVVMRQRVRATGGTPT